MLLDWIDPIDGWLGQLLHGSMHRFHFLRQGDFTGVQVELLLRQYGVRIWGREFDDPEEFTFLVKQKQAIWAEYVMCRAGVPLTGELLDPRNDTYRQRHAPNTMPRPWSVQGIGPHTFVDHVVDWLNRLLG